MNANLAAVDNQDKKTTYSLPVFITGGVILCLAVLFAVFGVISTAQVSEADSETINKAKTEAKSMVPAENAEMKETIETALIDSQSTNVPADLNLRNPFDVTVSSDRTTNQSAPVQPKVAAPTNAQPQSRLQPGNKTETNISSRTIARKMEEKPTAPTMPSFESRYKMWEQQIAAAQQNRQPEPSVGVVFSVTEVAPTGYLASGERKLANFVVLQNADNLADSFSLEQGERLYDALVSEITDSGVFYQFADGQRTFTPFASEREVKSRQSVPTQPVPPVMNSNPANGISKIVRGDSIDERLSRAVVDNQAAVKKDTLLALADLNASYTNTEFFNEEIVVRKSRNTDFDYFHAVDLINADDSKTAPEAPATNTSNSAQISPCDANFVGETIRYTSAANLTLNEFLRDLQKLYGLSFIVDKDVPDEPVILKVVDKPWNYALEAILRSKNLEARCLTGDIISIEPKGKQQKVDLENQKTEPLVLRKYTLRYIPLNSSNTAQIAGSVGGAGNGNNNGGPGIEGQINQLLGRSGDQRASVSRVPNSNILAVYATEKQQQEIDAFIREIDQPGFQVIIETNFYTVNDSKFKDVGGQFSVIIGNGIGDQIGGVTNLPPATNGTGGGTNNGGLNPGNVSSLPSGFGNPNNNLRANGNTLFGGSFTVGTATFNVLFSAAQQKGLANSQARSTQAVLDGGMTEIKNGDTIIIPTTGAVGGSLVNSGAITVNATQSAAIQPQVVVDKDGNPVAVTLNLQLTNNAINRAFLGTATPVVATQSQAGTVRLPLNQTYVVSGFFTDSVVNTRNDTPGLSKVPLLGELFKRRTDQIDRNRLYFAISVRVVRDTDLLQVPAPSDIDTTPVPAPDAQKPSLRKKDK